MLWIIGGTKDSREILESVLKKTDENTKIIVTTATEYGGKLLEDSVRQNGDRIRVISERLTEEQMETLISKNAVGLIIDASHPYAQNVSRSVIKVKEKMGVKYIRFERKMLDYGTENVIKFDSLEKMKEYVKGFSGKNILSTLGSNNLAEIKEMGENNNLYVRILPTTDSIKKAEDLGYLPAKIIAIQGPVGKKLNRAMMESYDIDYMITKESGEIGGEKEKVEACKEAGGTVLVLARPFVDYGLVYNDIDNLIKENF